MEQHVENIMRAKIMVMHNYFRFFINY